MRYHGFTGQFTGLDMAAVLALGRAKNVDDALMGEFLPDIERAIGAGMAKRSADHG